MFKLEKDTFCKLIERIKSEDICCHVMNNGELGGELDDMINNTGNILYEVLIPYDDFSSYRYLKDVFVCDERESVLIEACNNSVYLKIPISKYFKLLDELIIYSSHINNNSEYYLEKHLIYDKNQYDIFIEQCARIKDMDNAFHSVVPDDFKHTGRLYPTSGGSNFINFRAFTNPTKNKFVDKRMFLESTFEESTLNIIDTLIQCIQKDERFINTTMFYQISRFDSIHNMFPDNIIEPEYCESAYIEHDNIHIEVKVYDVFGVKYSKCNIVEITN